MPTVKLTLTATGLESDQGFWVDVFVRAQGDADLWSEVGRTPTSEPATHTTWDSGLSLEYDFETPQFLKFLLYRADEPEGWLGSCTISLGRIVARGGQTTISCLDRIDEEIEHCAMTVTASYEFDDVDVALLDDSADEPFVDFSTWRKRLALPRRMSTVELAVKFMTLQFSATQLPTMDRFGSADPFFRIYRVSKDRGDEDLVVESEVIKDTLTPSWLPRVIGLKQLCNNDLEHQLRIEVYDWNRRSDPDFIGEVYCTPQLLLDTYSSKERGGSAWLRLSDPAKLEEAKAKGGVYTGSGRIVVEECAVMMETETKRQMKSTEDLFKEYCQASEQWKVSRACRRLTPMSSPSRLLLHVAGGCSIRFAAFAGFDNPDGLRRDTSSMLYAPRTPDGESLQYEIVVHALGQVLEEYSDEPIWTYGFGGHIPGGELLDGTPVGAHDCFPLNLQADGSTCPDVEGFYVGYREALAKIQPLGAVNILPALDKLTSTARELHCSQRNQSYLVGLIVFHGCPGNLDAVLASLVSMSELPVSVILVGAGDCDYTPMRTAIPSGLSLLSHKGAASARPNASFIEFRTIRDRSGICETILSSVSMQFVSYFNFLGLAPNPAIVTPPSKIEAMAASTGEVVRAESERHPLARHHDDAAAIGGALACLAVDGEWRPSPTGVESGAASGLPHPTTSAGAGGAAGVDSSGASHVAQQGQALLARAFS